MSRLRPYASQVEAVSRLRPYASQVEEVADQRARLMERACSSLSGECRAAREATRRSDARLQEVAEATGVLKLSQGRTADGLKATEQELSEIRSEIASQVAGYGRTDGCMHA